MVRCAFSARNFTLTNHSAVKDQQRPPIYHKKSEGFDCGYTREYDDGFDTVSLIIFVSREISVESVED